jgi:hypothetical protein
MESVMQSIRTILFAADFSACSQEAYRLALAVARDYKAK